MRRLVYRAASRLARMFAPEESGNGPPTTTVAEITPCVPRPEHRQGARLNILLPSINAEHYFGGIHTAVLLYRSLCRHFPQSRIILVDAAPKGEALVRFPDHVLVDCDKDSNAARQIVAFNDRYGRTLPVCPGDVWVSTAWWTAYAAQRMAAWQQRNYGEGGQVTCLIQDFEPGFYPWSTRFALALSTYRPTRDIAVFNTQLLADYFQREGLVYEQRLVFEPTLNSGLQEPLAHARKRTEPRRRRIVVYGRPSTPRNAFELICESLRCWGWSDPEAERWEVVAPGELCEDVSIGPLTVRALGKLDITQYAELLSTSAVGLSLMVSPHPSYPPLEMAAFGMGVLTNDFSNKGLGNFSPNIRTLSDFSPESIASCLTRECEEWRGRGMMPLALMDQEHPFTADTGVTALANRLAEAMGSP